MNKIYTKTGDKGKTSLLGGKRVYKSNIQVQAYGTVDELNSLIGLIISKINKDKELKNHEINLISTLEKIQKNLMLIASALASLDSKYKDKFKLYKDAIKILEQDIDIIEKKLPNLKNFILPGGSEIASHLHVCRSVCRRAERKCVELNSNQTINEKILKYINRLSDWFFVAARLVNQIKKTKETKWTI